MKIASRAPTAAVRTATATATKATPPPAASDASQGQKQLGKGVSSGPPSKADRGPNANGNNTNARQEEHKLDQAIAEGKERAKHTPPKPVGPKTPATTPGSQTVGSTAPDTPSHRSSKRSNADGNNYNARQSEHANEQRRQDSLPVDDGQNTNARQLEHEAAKKDEFLREQRSKMQPIGPAALSPINFGTNSVDDTPSHQFSKRLNPEGNNFNLRQEEYQQEQLRQDAVPGSDGQNVSLRQAELEETKQQAFNQAMIEMHETRRDRQ